MFERVTIGVCSAIFLVGAAGAGLAGCSAHPEILPARVQTQSSQKEQWEDGPGGLRVIVHGDWDDVDAAVGLGVSRGEAAILSSRQDEGRREYELLSIDDEPGVLIAQPVSEAGEPAGVGGAGGASGSGIPIELTCRIGRTEDQVRERTILLQCAQRLQDLAGVDVRPVR